MQDRTPTVFHWMTQDAQTETEEWIEMLRYTLMRLGIFVGCFVVVWALVYSGVAPRGLGSSNGMWMILLALVVSAPISFIALRKERDRASAQIAPHLDERINRVKSNLAANRSVEDEADDEARKQSETASGQAQAS